MKKKCLLFLFSILFISIFITNNVSAATTSSTYKNDNGVSIPLDKYNYLKNFIPEGTLKSMDKDFYDSVKNVTFTVLNYEEKYVVTKTKYINGFPVETTEQEMEETDFNKYFETNNDRLSCNDGYHVCYETSGKKIFDQTSKGNDGILYINTELRWKTNPQVKSYDVIATRWTNSFSPDYFQGTQYYTDSNGFDQYITYNSGGSNSKVLSNGIGVSMNLVDSGSNFGASLFIRGSYVYGTYYTSYQHATHNVTLSQSKNYTLSSSGLGGVIKFNSGIGSYYDGMSGIYYTL